MITKKQIQSEIHVLKARKKQVKNSTLFSETEATKMIKKLNERLSDLANKIEVIDPEVL